ncbi:undecaprenyl-phosphate glucose phosphotransferase [uncultured Abyssibacter sp.]|uniref:undecaprenyl-phosphate glucose phosphotransferase n=1 Tax=uncultured Abyssibacter sp. TaxID=2320202 RepID=UPI0032B24E7D
MAQMSARTGMLDGVAYAVLVYAVLGASCLALNESFSGLYQAAGLIAGALAFVGMRGVPWTAAWQLGRPGSLGARLLWRWLLLITFLIMAGFFAQIGDELSRRVLALWFTAVPICMLVAHIILRYGLLRVFPGLSRQRTAVVLFVNNAARRLVQRLPDAGYRFVGYFEDREPARTGGVLENVEHLGKAAEAASYVRRNKVEVVFVCLPEGAYDRGLSVINELGDTTASVFYVPAGEIFTMMSAQIYDIEGIPVLEVIDTPFYGVDGILKRVFDIAFSLTMLVLSLPLMALIALAIKLDSKGPIIFRQHRYGLNGEEFDVHKFRSMSVMENDDKIEQVSRTDPRVTRVGRFLRRTSLDEWPQFWTVLKGDMSIVGPRPHAVAHNEFYRRAIQGYMSRHKVKPGVTGWAQVNGYRGETQTLDRMEKRIEYDLQYIRNWSPVMDLKIVVMTLIMIFKDENAY